ncbi:gluconolaconase [candidate division MSBL1 archaeon SCGC-AAA259E19]|uniref:Gluconolaconase n=1 Tax=candidate division MSBL1 archaeon SCGC-AAA259E19 TaxID=1698264 RepID=A0A133UJT4_9EURY|nr:gluconolaconase [candidate division MSBL1 archaeon SCGC-AAA259E19]
MKVENIADYKCKTGEGPLWHPMEKRLYWTDIPNGRMFRYDPSTGKHEQFYDGKVVGGFTIQSDGSLLLFMEKGSVRKWSDGEMETVLDEIPEEKDSRFNDVIADPEGRVFCGTMPTEKRLGNLYRLDIDGTYEKVFESINVPNGMGFNLNNDKFYFTESNDRKIHLFDYDRNTGEISNRRLFLEKPKGEGNPDGMTVDNEGRIWSARWDGGCLVRYDPDGNEEMRIDFPARKVSSVTFGGNDYKDIYVTTAGGDNKPEEGRGAGALFRTRVEEIKGRKEYFSRIQI